MNFLRSVIGLCTSFSHYRDFRDQAVSSSLKFLLKLIALLAAVVTASSVPVGLHGVDVFANRFDDHRPDFSIHEGTITSDAAQPYTWGDTDLRFILDTTGKITSADSNSANGVLFTADSFLYWVTSSNAPQTPFSTRAQSLRGFPNGAVNGDYFRHLVRAMLWLLVPLGWLTLIVLGVLGCLLQAYVFSALASWMERSMPAPLDLRQLLNIALYACTPATIVVAAYTAMHLHSLTWLIYLIVYGIFLIGATNACRDHAQAEPPEVDDLF